MSKKESQFKFTSNVHSKGVVKIKTEGKPFKENHPLDDKSQKEVAEYEKTFTKDFLVAAKDKAVELMLSDSEINDVQVTTSYGVQTYGTMTVRTERAFNYRAPGKDGKVTVAPRVSVKVQNGNVSKDEVKAMGRELKLK